jgi:hypothetical protein
MNPYFNLNSINKTMQPSIRLECKHCKNVWDYFGSSKYYACCSVCRSAVHVRKNRVGNNVALSKAKKLLHVMCVKV